MTSFQKLTHKALMLKMPANENSAEAFVIMAMAELDECEARVDALLFALKAVKGWK